MGHWSESLVDDVAKMVGGDSDREVLRQMLLKAASEIEILAGRSFGYTDRVTIDIASGGLPFADIPDLQRGTMDALGEAHAVPDPADKQMATVLQMAPLAERVPQAMPIGQALWVAGQLVAEASRSGRLSKDFLLEWLGTTIEHDSRPALFRRLMDPHYRFNVPILATSVGGWWFQITRRLVWVTNSTPDEGRLLEVLLDEGPAPPLPLAAIEAVLIVARLTSQPVDWAMTARVWPEGVSVPVARPWRLLAKAIHGHGVPVMTVDRASTPFEIACQLLLLAYWHGYLDRDEPGLAAGIAQAFPKQVDRVRRGTNAPNMEAAAATLLEGLIHPGFDPARGAEANRRYLTRKASIAVMEHHKRENADRYPWTRVGISERRYYKLLPRFAPKDNGRYVVDHDDIVNRMRAHLDARDQERTIRRLAMEVLQQRGFSTVGARKWLQRHPPEEVVNARLRGAPF
ncbi:MAG: hypothetical protein ACYCV4_17745 [Dermatophilaceae bacterium]